MLKHPVTPPANGWDKIRIQHLEDAPGAIVVTPSRSTIFADMTEDNRNRVADEMRAIARSSAIQVVIDATGSRGSLLSAMVADFRQMAIPSDIHLCVVTEIADVRTSLRYAFSASMVSVHKSAEEARLEVVHKVYPPYMGWDYFDLAPLKVPGRAEPAVLASFHLLETGKVAMRGQLRDPGDFIRELEVLGRSPLAVIFEIPPHVHPPFNTGIAHELVKLQRALTARGLSLHLAAHQSTAAKSEEQSGKITVYPSKSAALSSLTGAEWVPAI
jgi:hypothetical protein